MWYQGQEQCDDMPREFIPSKNTFIHFSKDVDDDCLGDLREHTSVWERQQSEPAPSLRRLLWESEAASDGETDDEANSACKGDEPLNHDDDNFDELSTSEPDTEPFCRQETEMAWPTYTPTVDLEQTQVSWPTMYPPGSHVAPNQVDLAGIYCQQDEVRPTATSEGIWAGLVKANAATEVSWPAMYPPGSHMAPNQVDLAGSYCPTAQQWQASSGYAPFAIGLDCPNSKTRSTYMMIPRQCRWKPPKQALRRTDAKGTA